MNRINIFMCVNHMCMHTCIVHEREICLPEHRLDGLPMAVCRWYLFSLTSSESVMQFKSKAGRLEVPGEPLVLICV